MTEDEEIMAAARRVMEITDRGRPERMCRACRNWNHWHLPDGPCWDARCECPRRPPEQPAY